MSNLYINTKSFHYLLPISIQRNLYDILVSVGEEQFAKKHLAKFYYIIHKLKEEVIINKAVDKYSFVNLHSNILDNLFGSRYTPKILKILLSSEIIETDKYYKIGSKSKGYRLTKKYYDEPFRWHYDNSQFTQKLIKYKEDKIKRYINKKEYQALWLNLTSLNLNYYKLNKYLSQCLNKLKLINLSISLSSILCTDSLPDRYIVKELIEIQIKLQRIIKISKIQYLSFLTSCILCTDSLVNKESNPLEKLINDITSIIKIIKKDWFFTIDNSGYRLHNNLTNLNKELRKCLNLNSSDDNINIDISCSQPSLLAFLCKEYFKSRSLDYMDYKDVVKYITICLQDDIYKYLMKKSGYEGRRSEFKDEFYQKILFGRVYKNELSDIFMKEFPNIWEIILEIKKNDYRQLSIQLQQLESNVMFSGIINRLLYGKEEVIDGMKIKTMEGHPDLLFLTIHDSIFTNRANKDLIYNTMKEVFYERFKENINLSVEDYRLEEELSNYIPDVKEMILTDMANREKLERKKKEKEDAIELSSYYKELGMGMEIIIE